MRRAMNRTVGDKTPESARYGSFLTVEWPSRKGFDRLGWILIRQALEGKLPLFTESPRRLILGNWVCGNGDSRNPYSPSGRSLMRNSATRAGEACRTALVVASVPLRSLRGLEICKSSFGDLHPRAWHHIPDRLEF